MVDVDARRIDLVRGDGTTSSHTDEVVSEVAPGLRIELADFLR